MKKWLLIYNNRSMFKQAPAALIFPRRYFRKSGDFIVKYWLKSDLLDQAAEDAATNKSLNKNDLKKLIKRATTQGLDRQRSLCFYEVGNSVIIREFNDSKELLKHWFFIKKVFEEDSINAEEYLAYIKSKEYSTYIKSVESAIARM